MKCIIIKTLKGSHVPFLRKDKSISSKWLLSSIWSFLTSLKFFLSKIIFIKFFMPLWLLLLMLTKPLWFRNFWLMLAHHAHTFISVMRQLMIVELDDDAIKFFSFCNFSFTFIRVMARCNHKRRMTSTLACHNNSFPF